MANIFVRDSNIVINIILFLMYSFKEEVLVFSISSKSIIIILYIIYGDLISSKYGISG